MTKCHSTLLYSIFCSRGVEKAHKNGKKRGIYRSRGGVDIDMDIVLSILILIVMGSISICTFILAEHKEEIWSSIEFKER